MPSLTGTINNSQLTINKRKGFTLIELLIAIAILSIIAGITATVMPARLKQGRDSRRKSDLDAVKKALYLFQGDSKSFCPWVPETPGNCPWIASFGDSTYGAKGTHANSLKTKLTPTYIKTVPQDPKYADNTTYDYHLNASATTFTLSADLENNNDSQRSPGCNAVVIQHDYCITD